ncbi:HEAT repeat domain-containing protein [Lentzea sp. NPDC058450]|uniref:HEAT repeat domain-containing protein n=1 Tax=Lentzea sp. NPDC058450 TaxID=3346505 RepID=UPI003656A1CC
MNIDGALEGVLDWRSPDRGKHIRVLVDSDEAGLDGRIEALLDEHSGTMAVAQVLCRVLAERDPDRDPAYVLEFFGKGRKGDPGDWLARKDPYRSVFLCVYGIPRLRRLNPVEHLAGDVRRWSTQRRGVATLGLGDTADAAAVPFVVPRLEDRRPKVRVQAVTAIRRLTRDGALGPESEDLVGEGLVRCLADRHDLVVRHAAAALAASSRERLVVAQRAGGLSPVATAAVDDALAGQVVDLIPVWPGEVTG